MHNMGDGESKYTEVSQPVEANGKSKQRAGSLFVHRGRLDRILVN